MGRTSSKRAGAVTARGRPPPKGTVAYVLPGGVRPACRGHHLPLPSSSSTLPPGSPGDHLRGISTVGRWIYLRCPRFLHQYTSAAPGSSTSFSGNRRRSSQGRVVADGHTGPALAMRREAHFREAPVWRRQHRPPRRPSGTQPKGTTYERAAANRALTYIRPQSGGAPSRYPRFCPFWHCSRDLSKLPILKITPASRSCLILD